MIFIFNSSKKEIPTRKKPSSSRKPFDDARRFYNLFLYRKAGQIVFPCLQNFLLPLAPFVSFADTFPDKRGQLAFCMLCFFFKLVGTVFLYDSFLYFCFYYIKTIILSSLVSASPALGGKCRALRGDRGMFAYTGQNTFCWFCSYLFFVLVFLLTLAPSDG